MIATETQLNHIIMLLTSYKVSLRDAKMVALSIVKSKEVAQKLLDWLMELPPQEEVHQLVKDLLKKVEEEIKKTSDPT